MEKEKFTKLTLEQNGFKITWEVPYNDVNGKDMMWAIHTIMVGMDFSDNTIAKSMANYIMEHYYNDYTIYEKLDTEENEVH